MRYAEIVPDPPNKSHYVIVDGKQWSRHNDVKIAEQVRHEIVGKFAEQLERKTDDLLAALSEQGRGPQP